MALHRCITPLTTEEMVAYPGNVLVDVVQPGAPLLVTFGFYSGKFAMHGISRALQGHMQAHLNRILIRDPLNSWFHTGFTPDCSGIADNLKLLESLIAEIKPSRILFAGPSMGAFAALLYGNLLRIPRIAAFGSISTIEPESLLQFGDFRWYSNAVEIKNAQHALYIPDLMRLPPALPGTEVWSVVGNAQYPHEQNMRAYNNDVLHAQRLARRGDWHTFVVQGSDHAVAEYLHHHKALVPILHMLLNDEPMSDASMLTPLR